MSGRELTFGALRLLLAWAVLSAVTLTWGEALVDAITPWLSWVAAQAMAGFDTQVALRPVKDEVQIMLDASALAPYVVAGDLTLPPGATMQAGTHVSHALIPPVLLFSLVLAWPAHGVVTWIARLLVAVMFSAILVSITTPLLLVGKLEMFLVGLAAEKGIYRPEGLLVDWTLFTEMGGRWLMPLLAAALTLILTREKIPGAPRKGVSTL